MKHTMERRLAEGLDYYGSYNNCPLKSDIKYNKNKKLHVQLNAVLHSINTIARLN